jgi:hypothetical protein
LIQFLIQGSTPESQEHFIAVAQYVKNIFSAKFLDEHGKNYLSMI